MKVGMLQISFSALFSIVNSSLERRTSTLSDRLSNIFIVSPLWGRVPFCRHRFCLPQSPIHRHSRKNTVTAVTILVLARIAVAVAGLSAPLVGSPATAAMQDLVAVREFSRLLFM
jgi:hypothetical protein